MPTETDIPPTPLNQAVDPSSMRPLSWSQLKTFNTCEAKYGYRYVDGIPAGPPTGPLIGGSAVHSTIEEAERIGSWQDRTDWIGDGPMVAYYLAALDAKIAETYASPDDVPWGGRGKGEDYRWWQTSGLQFLRRYQALRVGLAGDGYEVEPGGIEMEVLFTLPFGRRVKLYVDALMMRWIDRDTGETNPLLIDWKTGQVGRPARDGSALQLATYAVGIEATEGLPDLIDVALFVNLRAADTDRLIDVVDLRPLKEFVAPLYRRLHDRQIAGGPWDPQPGDQCGWCDVRDFCPVGSALLAQSAAQPPGKRIGLRIVSPEEAS